MKRLLLTVSFFCFITFLVSSAIKHIYLAEDRENPENLSSYTDTLNKDLPVKITPFNLEIIPPSSGVQFYKKGIVFLSHSKVEDRMISDHVSFGTLGTYYAEIADTTTGGHRLFSYNDPFPVPSESMTFSPDYSLMYYAKRPKNKDSEKIYEAVYNPGRTDGGSWISDDKPLSFCSDNSTYTHPVLSYSGDMLVFSSNRRGSSGGMDLYVTHKMGNTWSSPENLGKSLNTGGNEIFPLLDKDNNLYFSSDGHKGLGGYDLYFSKYNGKYWDKPVGLTKVINSENDELALRINPSDGTTAFLSVREKSGDRKIRLLKISFSDQYSLNRFSNLSNALKFAAGIDTSPFKMVSGDSTALAQARTVDAKSVTPALTAKRETEKQAAPKSDLPPAETGKPPVVKQPQAGNQPAVQPPSKPETSQPKPVDRTEIAAAEAAAKPSGGDIIVYRVQFFSSQKPKGSYTLTVDNTSHKTFEYFYNGLYRSCVGEFSNVTDAREFLKSLKQAGYNDAFVVVFRNNERSLDPALMK